MNARRLLDQKSFSLFLEGVPERLRALRGQVPLPPGDFSAQSLLVLEKWFRKELAKGRVTQEIEDCVWTFLAEAIIHRAGGRWELNDTKGDSSFGTAVVDHICSDFPSVTWKDQVGRLEYDPVGAWEDLVSFAESEVRERQGSG